MPNNHNWIPIYSVKPRYALRKVCLLASTTNILFRKLIQQHFHQGCICLHVKIHLNIVKNFSSKSEGHKTHLLKCFWSSRCFLLTFGVMFGKKRSLIVWSFLQKSERHCTLYAGLDIVHFSVSTVAECTPANSCRLTGGRCKCKHAGSRFWWSRVKLQYDNGVTVHHLTVKHRQQLLCYYSKSRYAQLLAGSWLAGQGSPKQQKHKTITYHTCNLNANKHVFIVNMYIFWIIRQKVFLLQLKVTIRTF